MTTPIMNVLDIAQQPPFVVGSQVLDRFTRAITALYEQQSKTGREAMLTDDCLSLIMRHRLAGGFKQFEPNKKLQYSIEIIAALLLSVANGLNTRLPDSFIEQCRNSTDEATSRFYKIISEAYITPSWIGKKAKEMPGELNNGHFKAILERGIEAGIIKNMNNGNYSWEKSLQLLAYFAIRVTKLLNLNKRYKAAASWKPFEDLFDIPSGKLRGKKSDWEKVSDNVDKTFRPNGWETIESLLNENVK